MVENGYLGVACEPNCVFQICNQPAILGFRLHDLLTGGYRADDVVAGYEKAWADFGRLDANGHYNTMILADSRVVRPNEVPAPWVDAWCGALMNTWNRDFVHEHYPRQVADFLVPGPDGTLSVRSAPAREVMGQPVVTDTCDFGWVAAWASEMGDAATLRGVLAHADRYMAPTWRDGGLYYPRNDTPTDADGNRTEIEPMTGNVLLGYARLNVPDGLWGLYNSSLGCEHFAEPALTELGPQRRGQPGRGRRWGAARPPAPRPACRGGHSTHRPSARAARGSRSTVQRRTRTGRATDGRQRLAAHRRPAVPRTTSRWTWLRDRPNHRRLLTARPHRDLGDRADLSRPLDAAVLRIHLVPCSLPAGDTAPLRRPRRTRFDR